MKNVLVFLFILVKLSIGSDNGIYLKTVENIPGSIDNVVGGLGQILQSSDYSILAQHEAAGPDLINKDDAKKCNLRAFVFVLQDKDYTEYLTSFGNKYLVAAFLKIGIYETEKGVQVNIVDPETIIRIVFNDLEGAEYDEVISGSQVFKDKLISTIHKLEAGGKVKLAQEPIRSAKALKKASKDMFMMVGPMTFFRAKDQFPQIYSAKADNSKKAIQELLARVEKNLISFTPSTADIEYQGTQNSTDLNWKMISKVFSPDSNAVVLGLTRPRTEALSFKIAGQPRANKVNGCPGIDHVSAYPVEVLIVAEERQVFVHTAREMFRMDMYFWDAGKMAFMEYMNMPKMLDKSLKKALLGDK